jgi:hypothetical protein
MMNDESMRCKCGELPVINSPFGLWYEIDCSKCERWADGDTPADAVAEWRRYNIASSTEERTYISHEEVLRLLANDN